MPFDPAFADQVQTLTTTEGTGAITPTTAVAGHRTFSSAFTTGAAFYYKIEHDTIPSEWELGRGVLQSNGTISRDPLTSSNGGALVNLSAGTKTIAVTVAAEWFSRIDEDSPRTEGNNTAVGDAALGAVTTGSSNIAVGASAGLVLTTGGANVMIGQNAGGALTTGTVNVAVGHAALDSTAGSASYNVAVGAYALTNYTGSGGTAVGYSALAAATGVANTAIGGGAGGAVTTGSYVTYVGYNAGYNASQKIDAANATAIGAQAYNNFDNQVALGDDAVRELRLFNSNYIRGYGQQGGEAPFIKPSNVIIGPDAGNRTMTGGGLVIVGYEAGVASTNDQRGVIMGYLACNQGSGNRAWVSIGDRTGEYAQNTIDCTVVGSMAGWWLGRLQPLSFDDDPIADPTIPNETHLRAAGNDLTHGGELPAPGLVGATFFGKNAGRFNTIGLNNTGLGDSALGYTTVGDANVAVGYVCGEGNVVGNRNTWMGQGVRVYQYSGDDNVQIGYEIGTGVGSPGDWLSGGSRNSNVGTGSAFRWRGEDTTSLGFQTLRELRFGIGGDVAIGAEAGKEITTGGGNIFIGQGAGYGQGQALNVQNSIAIGKDAVTSANNQIVIGNAATAEVVLYGAVKSLTASGPGPSVTVNSSNSTGTHIALQNGGAAAGRIGASNGGVLLQDFSNATRLAVNSNGAAVTGSLKLGSYTLATLPSASAHGAGAIIFVSDESGGGVPAFSDATNWRRMTDRAIVT